MDGERESTMTAVHVGDMVVVGDRRGCQNLCLALASACVSD